MNFNKMLMPKMLNQTVIDHIHDKQNLDTSQLYLPSQLGQVNELLKDAEGDVTFWGTRCIKKAGSTETASLDVLTQRVVNASQYAAAHCDDLTLEQRRNGVDIVNHVRQFLHQSDRQIQQANVVTRLFVWVRKKLGCSHTHISHIVDGVASQEFRSFSVGKFLETFQGKFDENDSHPFCEKHLRSLDRIVATQKAIANPSDFLQKISPEVIGLVLSRVTGSLANTSEVCKELHEITKTQLVVEFKTLVKRIITQAHEILTTPQKDSPTGNNTVVSPANRFADFDAQIPKCFDKLSFQETKNVIRIVFLKLAIRMKVYGANALQLKLQADHQSSFLNKSLCLLWNDILQRGVKRRHEGEGVCVGLLSQGDLTTARATEPVAEQHELLGSYRTHLLAHGKVEEACVVRNNHRYLSGPRNFVPLVFDEAFELITCFLMRDGFTEQKFIAAQKAIDQMEEQAGRSYARFHLLVNLCVNKKWKEGLQTCQAIEDNEMRKRGLGQLKLLLLLANKPQEAAETIQLYSDKNMQLQEISFVIKGYLSLGKTQEAIQFATVFSDQPEIISPISRLLFDLGFVTQAQALVSKMTDSDLKKEVLAYASKEGSEPKTIDQEDILRWVESVYPIFTGMEDNTLRRLCARIILHAFFGERAKAISLVKGLSNNQSSNRALTSFSEILLYMGEIEEALEINKMISDASERFNNLLTLLTICPGCLGKVGGMQKIVEELSHKIQPSPELLGKFCVHAIHFGYAAEVLKIIQNFQGAKEFGHRIICALLVRRPDLVTPELCAKLAGDWCSFTQILYSLLLVGDVDKAMQIGERCAKSRKKPEIILHAIYLIVIDFLITKNDLKKAIELTEKSPLGMQKDLKTHFNINHINLGTQESH